MSAFRGIGLMGALLAFALTNVLSAAWAGQPAMGPLLVGQWNQLVVMARNATTQSRTSYVREAVSSGVLEGQVNIDAPCTRKLPNPLQCQPYGYKAGLYRAIAIAATAKDGTQHVTHPNRRGRYQLTLPPGPYALSISAPGWQMIQPLPQSVNIQPAQHQHYDLHLDRKQG